MFRNYLKIALRNFARNKLYTFINIAGLAIGIAACAMIYFWVQDELSYDRFHRNAERIYRVERRWDFREMHGQGPLASGPWGPALVRDYPEIEGYVRLESLELSIKDHRNTFRKQRLLAADNSIFDIFDFRLENGDASRALVQPYTVVLTTVMAYKYFGTEDAIGKFLAIDWMGHPVDFEVTGILEKVPANSHIHFDMLVSLSSYPDDVLNQWFGNLHYTYVLLSKEASVSELEDKFPAFLKKYVAAEFLAYFGPDIDVTDVFQVKLKPLLDIHLYPSKEWEIEPQGKMISVYLFSVVAFLILIVAGINFMNLSTARAARRAKEVGLRKTIGANKRQLQVQFIGESLLLAFAALLLAFGLIDVAVPVFNSISGKAVSINLIFQFQNWLILIGIGLISGFLAGLYPAFYLSAFEPVTVLKGSLLSGAGKSAFRRAMAVIQFAISIAIIIGTLTVYRQMVYMQNKSLGFDKENIITIPVENNRVRGKMDAFRNALLGDPRIKSVSGSSNIPGSKMLYDTNFRRVDNGETYNLLFINTDYDFIDTYKLDVIRGRQFSKDFGMDAQGAFILNEKAVNTLGYQAEEVIGKKLEMTVGNGEALIGEVIGVINNFHIQSLHLKIQPLLFLLASADDINKMSVRIAPGDVPGAINYIKQKWEATFSGEVFEYDFLDSRLDQLYDAEKRAGDIFFLFSILSIFIACLGLWGLAAYTAEERTKEIGVRKVLGASAPGIVLLLSNEFTKWVLIANCIAWPLAWFVMNRWLQDFAYRIDVGIWIFLLAGALALVIAQLTVIYQSIKAAIANPVDSLRYE
jgi:putative ABC transport system permease protein